MDHVTTVIERDYHMYTIIDFFLQFIQPPVKISAFFHASATCLALKVKM